MLSTSALTTDFYQLTMAYSYWQRKMHEQEAAFHLIFRHNPFKGNYALCCGLESIIDFLHTWHFSEEDIAYLASLHNAAQKPIFPKEFLDYLRTLKFTGNVDAIPEGTVVFPNEPLIRLQGELLQCQLLETPLLAILNFQTLIATKTSRIVRAAKGDPVIEFGMRRAQGLDGALSASRAAYIGGCVATSNTLAGKYYDIPVRGTHGHSWVTSFPSEKEAFAAYAESMPENCTLLVDTFDTITGVNNAIEIGKKLRKTGNDLVAIRLDSGNMAALSIKARQLLDAAGFSKTAILASNTLDEYVIQELKQRGAKISMWGVGTHLVTSYDQPALDGVYKLTALRNPQGQWEYKLKISEDAIKTSNPGRQQVRRFFCNEQYVMDVIYDIDLGIGDIPEAVTIDPQQRKMRLDDYDAYVDLLQPIMLQGKRIAKKMSIHNLREQAIKAVSEFYQAHDVSPYAVGLEKNLYELKQQLILKMK